jgi:two-component system NarL family response regulator
MSEQRIRVLLADDHPVVLEGLAAVLSYQGDMSVVGTAKDGREAVARFRELHPDVALLDLRMPELTGLQAIRAIRDQDADARLIVLTTFDGDEDVYRALEAGAQGYLLKDSSKEELLAAVRAVYAGRRHVPAAVAARLAERAQAGPDLTPREREVLERMAAGKANKEIGASLAITEATVKSHVNSILQKLGVADRTQAVTVAIRRGILRL